MIDATVLYAGMGWPRWSHQVLRHAALGDFHLVLAPVNVDYFISEDKDFTSEDATTAELRKRLNVMRSVIFLREVMGWSSEELEEIRQRNWPVEEG